ncbi:MAG: HAD-IA family hydrolase [Methylobacteriaceae bacterium]|nr:HAD-IA family hydrolase [Methylobacteriaceae bacterium]
MTLLIFDCDGVIVDSEPIANAVLAETLTALGRPMTAAESMRTQIGKSLADILRETEEILGQRLPGDVGATMNARLFARFRAELKAIDGVEAALAALPAPRCLASSSTPERIDVALAATGLDRHFVRRFSATQVARGKPAPDLFLFAAREMGVAPARAIVIEDSVAGVAAARAAGMTAIGFVGGGHADATLRDRLAAAGAARVIAHMRELPTTVAALQDTAS